MANQKKEIDRYDFLQFINTDKLVDNPLGDTAFRFLEDLADKAYYLEDDYAWQYGGAYSYAEECFFNEKSILGVKIAVILSTLLSSETDNIQFIDVVNPFEIPNIDFTNKFVSENKNDTLVFEDETFVCGIVPKDKKNKHIIKVYFFKK